MKTFLSFSSLDKDFVSKFKSRLIAQNINIWDYSYEGEEIPGGVKIDSYLEERVSGVDLFIPLVTKNSMASNYAQIEVSKALESHEKFGKPRIIPIVDEKIAEDEWNNVFRPLKQIRFFKADFVIRDSWEEVIARICYSMNISYNALIPDNKLLPFLKRFDEELRDPQLAKGERYDSVYRRLTEIRNHFVEAVDDYDYSSSLKHINYFIDTCDYEFPHFKFYFIKLAKAVCLLGLGIFSEALEITISLKGHKRCDETRYGIIGYIKQQQGLYSEAVKYYQLAHELDTTDPAAATGLIVNKILSNQVNNIDNLLTVIEKGYYHTKLDRQRAFTAYACALAVKGKSYRAVQLFKNLAAEKIGDAELYIHFARALFDLNKISESKDVLKLGLKNCIDTNELYKWKMNLHLSLNETVEALETISEAINKFPDNCTLNHYHQLCLFYDGKVDDAIKVANMYLSFHQMPSNKDEFYYAGFANYLLNLEDRAKYDFERSGRDYSEYYGNYFSS